MSTPCAERTEHGPKLACYRNVPWGNETMITCLCGEVFTGDSWKDVGAAVTAPEPHPDPNFVGRCKYWITGAGVNAFSPAASILS